MLETAEDLQAEIDRVYDLLANKSYEFFGIEADLYDAKFLLARVIDAAYDAGGVMGKNEREREAFLRQALVAEYGQVDDLERKLRHSQRGLRDAEIAAEKLRLKISVATAIRNS